MVGERARSFVGSLTSAEREALESCGRARSFPRGEILFREGEPPEDVVVILAGRVKVSRFTIQGREVVLSVAGPGEILGELSALDGEPRSATATTLDPIEALVISTSDFLTYLQAHARIAMEIMRGLARRLREADQDRMGFSALDTIGRVASRIVQLAERFGEGADEGIRIDLPLSQTELAGWTGASREAVSKALQTLRESKLIKTHRRAITVVDLEALRDRVI